MVTELVSKIFLTYHSRRCTTAQYSCCSLSLQ